MTIKIKKLYPDVMLPIMGSENAACYDVYANSIEIIGANKAKIGLGFATEIPIGYKGVIIPRSNLTKHNWIINNAPACIDSDYRGEWMIIFTSINNITEFPYKIGERIAQIYFEKVLPIEFELTDNLSETVRNNGGFGSSGLK
jgi:dUTP pyrophosphatase